MMKKRKVPMRMCIGCKQMKPKKDLLRIVQPKEGAQSTDPTGKAQGRGAYVCKDMECLQLAMKSRSIKLAPEVAKALEQEIQKDG